MYQSILTSLRTGVRAIVKLPSLVIRKNVLVSGGISSKNTSSFGSGSNGLSLIVGGGDGGATITDILANPTLGFQTGFGRGSGGGNQPDLFTSHGTVFGLRISNSGLYLNSGQPLYFTSSTSYGTAPDCSIFRDSSATLQMGQDSSGPPDQTWKAADGVGTDVAGARFTFAGGQSTGAGRGGAIQLSTSLASSTGAVANSYSVRQYHSAKPVDLAEGTDTQFVSISLAASTIVGLHLACTVWASDGTDLQSLQSQVSVTAVNKAGTLTISTILQSDTGICNSSGTLSPVTYTAAASGNNLVLRCNATSSLTQTVLRLKWSIISCNSTDIATVTPS